MERQLTYPEQCNSYMAHTSYAAVSDDDGDGVYYYIGERLKLEGETENTVW